MNSPKLEQLATYVRRVLEACNTLCYETLNYLH
jgi:hypothetical protein